MEIHIGNRVADVSLVNKEGNKVQLTIDGKPYEVDIVMAENGSCSILHEGNSYNAELIQKESKKSYDVNIFYRSYRIDIVDTQAKYLRMKKGDDTRQDDKIIAPMPRQSRKDTGTERRSSSSRRYCHRTRSNENAKQLQGELGMYRQRHSGERRRFGKRKSDIDFIGNHK